MTEDPLSLCGRAYDLYGRGDFDSMLHFSATASARATRSRRAAPHAVPTRTFTTPSVDCGGTITTEVKPTAPMNREGEAWTIGADGVDIDLGGNTYRKSTPTRAGITNDGFDDVTIRNTLSGNAGDGIEVQSAGARIGDNAATDNGDFGIDMASGVIDLGGNRASGNGNALQCRNVFCTG